MAEIWIPYQNAPLSDDEHGRPDGQKEHVPHHQSLDRKAQTGQCIPLIDC